MKSATAQTLGWYKQKIDSLENPFIAGIPKIELHVHLEGTLTPALRWKLAQKQGLAIYNTQSQKRYESLEELKQGYHPRLTHIQGAEGRSTFFADYYSGFEVLQDEDDFFELAWNYFTRAAAMNVRFCEVFFDPQGHTERGVPFEVFMRGLKRAREAAVSNLNVHANLIMCMLRDQEVSSAVEHYKQPLPYRDMVVGIGLDSLENGRPPLLFEPLFEMAREDGFKITCHCDIGQQDKFSNINEVLKKIGGGTGADRCDHGISATRNPALMKQLASTGIGMTLCPWCYFRYPGTVEPDIPGQIRMFYDAGVKITINSDDPAYMDDMWIEQNLKFVRQHCNFTDADIKNLQLNAVDICWADVGVKAAIRKEIEEYNWSADTVD